MSSSSDGTSPTKLSIIINVAPCLFCSDSWLPPSCHGLRAANPMTYLWRFHSSSPWRRRSIHTLSRAQLKSRSVNAAQMSGTGCVTIDTMLEADGVSTGLRQGRARRRRRRGQATERSRATETLLCRQPSTLRGPTSSDISPLCSRNLSPRAIVRARQWRRDRQRRRRWRLRHVRQRQRRKKRHRHRQKRLP